MNDENASLEALIQKSAAAFPYPPTPDVTAGVRGRLTGPSRLLAPVRPRLAWAIALLLLLLAGLLAVPAARAAIFEIIRAGAITIFAGEPAPTIVPATPSSSTAPWPDEAALDPANLTTLEEARRQARFPLRLPPAYGRPDELYLQETPDPAESGQVVIMVWRRPAQEEGVRLQLYQIGIPYYGLKQASVDAVTQTEVNGQTAFWVEGGHRLQLSNGREQDVFFVEHNVLIWVDGEVTYRLVSELSKEEAVQVAESLRADLAGES